MLLMREASESLFGWNKHEYVDKLFLILKHKHFKFTGFLNISGYAEIHKIPKIWEKWIPIIREGYGKK